MLHNRPARESCWSPRPPRHRAIRVLIQGPLEKATSHEAISTLSLGYLQLVSLETVPGSHHVRPGLELGGLQGRQPSRSPFNTSTSTQMSYLRSYQSQETSEMDEDTRNKFSLRTLNFVFKLTTVWDFYFTDSFLEQGINIHCLRDWTPKLCFFLVIPLL